MALVAVLAVGWVVVPCAFTSRLPDIFVLPKLSALWLILVVGLLLVALSALSGWPSGSPIRWSSSVDIAGISFVGLNLLAAANSTDHHQSLFGERWQYQGLLTVLLYLGLFLLARHAIYDARALTLLFTGITLGAALVAGYAIMQRVGVDPFWKGYLPNGRVFSTIGQSNSLAAYLVMALPIAAYFLWSTRGAVRALVFLVTLEIVVALLLTLSRGGFLGLLMLAIIPISCVRRKKRAAVMFSALLLAMSAGALLLEPARHAVTEAWDQFASRGGGEGRTSIRIHVDSWKVAARISLDNPLLGTGQETFPDVFPRYKDSVLPPERSAFFDAFRVESPHNVYLSIAATTGIPALMAYIALIVGSLLLAVRSAGRTSDRQLHIGLLVIVASVIGHLVTDLFMTAELTSTALFWTLAGAGMGVLTVGDAATDSSEAGGAGNEGSPAVAACTCG